MNVRCLPFAVAVAALALGCASPSPRRQPDVILITVDTLRADHVSSYGYWRETTPFLDRLASRGVRFTRSYSTSSWTVPSIASLLTSLYPDSHGVVTGVAADGHVYGQQVLSPDLPRLPELLRDAGYRTYGITSNGHLDYGLGFGEGFDRYANLGFGGKAGEVNATLARWKDEIANGGPSFVWLHYFDPHAPYFPHERWTTAFAEGLDVEAPGRLVVRAPSRYAALGVEGPGPELDYVVALYDGEIAFTDERIRDAVHLLDPRSEALIVVTADHGEEFLDHGGFGHAGTLYEELIRVPLIVRFPGEAHAGGTVAEPVSLVDVGPGVLDFLGLATPDAMQGESFLPRVEGRLREAPRPIVVSLARDPGRRIDALVYEDWKYIRDTGSRPAERIFRLDRDPRESGGLDGAVPRFDLAALLDDQLRRLAAPLDPAVRTVTRRRLDELRSLGYVR